MAIPRAKRGDAFRPSATTFNLMADAADAYRNSGMVGGSQVDSPYSPTVIMVKNSTGSDVERFDVIGIGGTIYDPTDSDELTAFKHTPVIDGAAVGSGHAGLFLIAIEPIGIDAIGNAAIAGVVPVQVNMTDSAHEYADVTAGDPTKLTSGATGSAKILDIASGTGTKWAYVRLGDDAAGGGGAFATDGSVTNQSADDGSDFVFGSPQLADDGDSDHDSRFYFDKTASAFRAGLATSTEWDSPGNYSCAIGSGLLVAGEGGAAFGLGNWISAAGTGSFAAGMDVTITSPYSFGMGNFCTISGDFAVGFGEEIIVSGNYSFALGSFVTASGVGSIAIGLGDDDSNRTTSTGHLSIAIGGNAHATADFAIALGEYAVADKFGEIVRTVGNETYRKQWMIESMSADTGNDSWTEMLLQDGAGRLVIPVDTVWMFTVKISAYNIDQPAAAGYYLSGTIANFSGNTYIVGTVSTDGPWEDFPMAAAEVRATADNTNDALKLEVKGVGTDTVSWFARVDISSVGEHP